MMWVVVLLLAVVIFFLYGIHELLQQLVHLMRRD
jgi:hypothetical protein